MILQIPSGSLNGADVTPEIININSKPALRLKRSKTQQKETKDGSILSKKSSKSLKDGNMLFNKATKMSTKSLISVKSKKQKSEKGMSPMSRKSLRFTDKALSAMSKMVSGRGSTELKDYKDYGIKEENDRSSNYNEMS